MLIQFNQQVDKINDILAGRIKEGLSLGIKPIDEYLRFKPGNFNVILGHANVGKTNLTLYLMLLYSIKHDLKWLIFSSENEPYTLIKKMVEFLEVDIINRVPKHYLEERLEWINDHFKFIETICDTPNHTSGLAPFDQPAFLQLSDASTRGFYLNFHM